MQTSAFGLLELPWKNLPSEQPDVGQAEKLGNQADAGSQGALRTRRGLSNRN